MLRPSSQSSSLFPSIRCRQAERVDLLLLGLTPVCVCSSFILATGCCFRRQELTSTRFSEEATFEGQTAESPHPSVAWSVEAALPSAVSLLSSWWCCFSTVFAEKKEKNDGDYPTTLFPESLVSTQKKGCVRQRHHLTSDHHVS
ncbi:unnamed protein product [Brassica rapa subsp. trilocularis]